MYHVSNQYNIYILIFGIPGNPGAYFCRELRHCVPFLGPLCGIAKFPVSSIHSVFVRRVVFAPLYRFLRYFNSYLSHFWNLDLHTLTLWRSWQTFVLLFSWRWHWNLPLSKKLPKKRTTLAFQELTQNRGVQNRGGCAKMSSLWGKPSYTVRF